MKYYICKSKIFIFGYEFSGAVCQMNTCNLHPREQACQCHSNYDVMLVLKSQHDIKSMPVHFHIKSDIRYREMFNNDFTTF